MEEQAQLDTSDARLKSWLLEILPELRNVLVVFAGRPRKPNPNERTDHQARLERDLKDRFGGELEIHELQPLTRAETAEFVARVPGGAEVLSDRHMPVVHRLTGGRPIFLHLLIDLLRAFAINPRAIYSKLEEAEALVDVAEDDPALAAARAELQKMIVSDIFNNFPHFGNYLGEIALMPKGIDHEILVEALALSRRQAFEMLEHLADLSFVKRYAPPAYLRSQGERLFLHDEMYAMLNEFAVYPHRRQAEKKTAKALIACYYDPQIRDLQRRLAHQGTDPGGIPQPDHLHHAAEQRIPLRERLQKLLVERLYYYLVWDVERGYAEYRRLSDVASRQRQVGHAMQVLDEFLRFYNNEDRRQEFRDAGISDERVIRENALLWLERFHWWGDYGKGIALAKAMLNDPAAFHIRDEDVAVRGNIVALLARQVLLTKGDHPGLAGLLQSTMDEVRATPLRGPELLIAHARIATSLGWWHDLDGDMPRAKALYREALRSFRELDSHEDELGMLLNNLAFLHALQGEMVIARTLAREALSRTEKLRQPYSEGLTLTTLATVEIIEGGWAAALNHAREALQRFEEIEDGHGMVLALVAIAQAMRKSAKYEIQKDRNLESARLELIAARRYLDRAVEIASQAGLAGDLVQALGKLAKVCRELGTAAAKLEGPQAGSVYFRDSEEKFRGALAQEELGILDRANLQVDYAEMLLVWGDTVAADERLEEFDREWGSCYRQQALPADFNLSLVERRFLRPLGKAERLKGRIALQKGERDAALRHFARAYACFQEYSPSSREKDSMVEWVYDQLLSLPYEDKQALVNTLSQGSAPGDNPAAPQDFLATLTVLFCVS